ncbi:MAG: hypothetical protein RR540_05510 [Oscillospiraceae bacterium]
MSGKEFDIEAFKNMNIVEGYKEKHVALKWCSLIFVVLGILEAAGCIVFREKIMLILGEKNYIPIILAVIFLVINFVIAEAIKLMIDNANNVERLIIYTSRNNQILNKYLKGEYLAGGLTSQSVYNDSSENSNLPEL